MTAAPFLVSSICKQIGSIVFVWLIPHFAQLGQYVYLTSYSMWSYNEEFVKSLLFDKISYKNFMIKERSF